jgi:hypothetical protein
VHNTSVNSVVLSTLVIRVTYVLRTKNMIAAITRTISRTVPIKPKPMAASIRLSSFVRRSQIPIERIAKHRSIREV